MNYELITRTASTQTGECRYKASSLEKGFKSFDLKQCKKYTRMGGYCVLGEEGGQRVEIGGKWSVPGVGGGARQCI